MAKYYSEPVQCITLAKSDPSEELPEWYELLPEGIVEFQDGIKVQVDKAAFDRIVDYQAARGVDLVFDYEHQTRPVDGKPVKAPAAGWIKELRWDKGIWAKVDWTLKAVDHLLAKEYRYSSAGMFLKHSDRNDPSIILALDHVALTNVPRVNNNKPLNGKVSVEQDEQEVELNELQDIAKALGLAEDASLSDCLSAIQKLKGMSVETASSVPGEVLKSLELKEGSSTELVLAKVEALQAQAAGLGEDVQLELAKLKEAVATNQAEKLLEKYSDKLTPAMLEKTNAEGKPFWLELAKSDPDGVDGILEDMPVQKPAPLPAPKKEAKKVDKMTPDQVTLAKAFGFKPDEFLNDEEVE